ncbi:MAG TPA: hypothetical protein VFY17_07860 [Pilimelia sp.]|nr:hypothetical protein [Pilimelia sp.]
MSQDAPPHGQPPEPRAASGDATEEPYDEPSDPWGGNGAPLGPWTHPPQDMPAYDPTGMAYAPPSQPRPVPQPRPGTPAAAPELPAETPTPRGRRSFMVALSITVLALLAVAGWGVGIYLWGRQGAQVPLAVRTAENTPPPYPATSAAVDPDRPPQAGEDARNATTGQCLTNRGTQKKPDLRVTGCTAAEYRVLARFDGTRDYNAKCKGKINGYEFYYYFDAADDSHDFVLCLSRRAPVPPR